MDKSKYARKFDADSVEFYKDPELNKTYLRCQQNYFNHILNARGHVFLNEVYDALDIPRSIVGQIVGWTKDAQDVSRGFIEIKLLDDGFVDFNVGGVILGSLEG